MDIISATCAVPSSEIKEAGTITTFCFMVQISIPKMRVLTGSRASLMRDVREKQIASMLQIMLQNKAGENVRVCTMDVARIMTYAE